MASLYLMHSHFLIAQSVSKLFPNPILPQFSPFCGDSKRLLQNNCDHAPCLNFSLLKLVISGDKEKVLRERFSNAGFERVAYW